jgi:2'-5' RNA ligase
MHRGPIARLFVAIDPPGSVRKQLAEWARAALCGTSPHDGDSPPRILGAELLHVTLCFLGNRPAQEIDAIAAQLATCGGPIGKLSLGAPLWLPSRRPRALAVELHDAKDRLASLRESVVTALEHLDEGEPVAVRRSESSKHRHFRPHVTVARMRSGTASRERALPPTPALSFLPSELVLYRSRLSPEGASYEALASHPIA